jgi:NitT/TauT family transport system ATP-binding protein
VVFVGPSGCGKTTLLRMVGGLERPTAGIVLVDGDTPAQARKAKRFALVPQSPALLPWRTVEQNARLLTEVNRRAGAARVRDTGELLQRVGLAGFAKAKPHQLSGGMQQRVGLVRAFALGAEVLLMDEPFAALDEMTREDMRHLLRGLWEGTGTTVLFTTHSLTEAVLLADRVVVMSHRPGRVVADVAIDLGRHRGAELEDDPRLRDHVAALRTLLRRESDQGPERAAGAGAVS